MFKNHWHQNQTIQTTIQKVTNLINPAKTKCVSSLQHVFPLTSVSPLKRLSYNLMEITFWRGTLPVIFLWWFLINLPIYCVQPIAYCIFLFNGSDSTWRTCLTNHKTQTLNRNVNETRYHFFSTWFKKVLFQKVKNNVKTVNRNKCSSY